MKGTLFNDSEGKQYYYSPITGKIVLLQRDVSEEEVTEEEGRFNFELNEASAREKLNASLENLVIESTQNCNLRCGYCIYGGSYNGEREHSKEVMSKEVAQKASDQFIEHSEDVTPFRTISFYGGEPLLNFEIMQDIVMRHRRQQRVKFSVSTNGTLLSKHSQFIMDNDIIVALSLDGPKEVHDQQRVFPNAKGSFDRVMHELKAFDEGFLEKNLCFSATIHDRKNLLLAAKYFSQHFPSNVMRIGFTKKWDFQGEIEGKEPTKEDFRKLSQMYRQGIKEGNVPNFLKFFFDRPMFRIHSRGEEYTGEPLAPRGYCVPGARKLFVKPDGRFYACEKLGYPEFEIGDVNSGILEEKVMNLMRYVTSKSKENCSSCWATRLCDLCIMLDSTKEGKIDSERLETNCSQKKQSIKDYLGLYSSLYKELGERFIKYVRSIETGD